jgi:hypothetical protein
MKFFQGCIFTLSIVAVLVLGYMLFFYYATPVILIGFLFSCFLLANSIRMLCKE